MAEQLFFTTERRAANTNMVLQELKNIDKMDFNSMVFTFADIIHTSFLQGLHVGKSQEEREASEERIIQLNHALIDVLNAENNDMRYDMVVLAGLLMDAVENATQLAMQAAATEEK